ncbi:MAG TPA: maleylpyruvate isomerase family mycothiol-dependent enzyme [Acidimicrobiia bacterium]|nr:maleylpyruvate isomerase family mycothiol-dependent enzyme [Acidimicrobiia bacterium]
MDATTALQAAHAGIVETAQRVAILLGSLADATAPIRPGTWTVREAAVHLTTEANHCVELAHGAPSPAMTNAEFNAFSEARIADIPETDPQKLSELIREAAHRLLDATDGHPGDQPVTYYGLPCSLAHMMGVELGEFVVHGYDIAEATGHPWPIDPLHAQLSLHAYAPIFQACVRPKAAKAHTAAYGIDLRGGEGFVIRFSDGQFAWEGPGSGPVDCVISADPVALLMAVLGRLSQWEAIALGLFSSSGNRPELALGFLDLFAIP